jgi:hypothetical protein
MLERNDKEFQHSSSPSRPLVVIPIGGAGSDACCRLES